MQRSKPPQQNTLQVSLFVPRSKVPQQNTQQASLFVPHSKIPQPGTLQACLSMPHGKALLRDTLRVSGQALIQLPTTSLPLPTKKGSDPTTHHLTPFAYIKRP